MLVTGSTAVNFNFNMQIQHFHIPVLCAQAATTISMFQSFNAIEIKYASLSQNHACMEQAVLFYVPGHYKIKEIL